MIIKNVAQNKLNEIRTKTVETVCDYAVKGGDERIECLSAMTQAFLNI